MPFDLNSAKPVGSSGGFDLGTAKPVGPSGGAAPDDEDGNIAQGLLRGFQRVVGTLGDAMYKVLPDNPRYAKQREEFKRFNADLDASNTGPDGKPLPLYGAGDVGGQVITTAPVGGAVAAPLKALAAVAPRAAPFIAPIADAIETSGMRAAGMTGVKGVATRSVGGAVTGGTSAALVDPESAGTGAAIGGALPPVLQATGAMGRVLAMGWRHLRNQSAAAGDDLARALGLLTPQDRAEAIRRLREAQTLVPGAPPTVAQALMTPEASITQRVVADSPGGAALRAKIVQQGEARNAALEGVAQTDPRGLASARDDLGQTVARTMIPARNAEKTRVRELYDAVDPEGAVRLQLPLDDFTAARDRYLGAGTFGQGKGAADALKTAREIGLSETPTQITKAQPLKPGPATGDDMTLGAAVRQVGIHPDELRGGAGYSGEVKYMKESKFGKNLVTKNGKSLDHLAERMFERGYLEEPDVGRLIEALSSEASGFPVFSKNASPEVLFGRARDANMPERFITPGKAEPVAVDWRTLQNFRGSVGDAAAAAEAKGTTQDAAALNAMKAALGSRVDQAGAQGLLKPGEQFPLDAYARWTDANNAHAAMKQRFDTGPLAGMFRKGPTGEPALQGGEIAARAWGNRPGLAEDVEALRRLVDDNPQILGRFRSMVTTEGASTADAAGNLTTKFSKWVDSMLPGLRKAFPPEQVDVLRRVAADIERATAAQKLGTSLGGSNTYQNAQNALNLGLLDNPMLTRAANMIPGVRYAAAPALEGVRGYARNAKATRLAQAIADSQSAAAALEAQAGASNPVDWLFARPALQFGYRAAPLLGAGSP